MKTATALAIVPQQQHHLFTPEEEAQRLTLLLPQVNRTKGGQRIAFENGTYVWITKRKKFILSPQITDIEHVIATIAPLYRPLDDIKRRRK